MPKNKGRNAYFFFMIDWKKEMEAEGRTFPNGLRDVQADPDCSKEWEELPEQKKGYYKAMAKRDKVTAQMSNMDKKTTYGESIALLKQKEKEAEMFKKNMHEKIKFLIGSAVNLNFLPQVKFCFVHVNWFFTKCVNNSLEYFPAEYAFGMFSLEKGIEEVHHVIVSAEIPLGYKREALETSQNSHHVPVEYNGGETDFAVMYEKLASFFESKKLVDSYPYIYTTSALVTPVQSLITKLCNAAEQDKEQFKIYELEALFMHLANEVYKKRTDRDIKCIPIYAGSIFTLYTYIHEQGFECHFHKYVDGGSEYCSKSVLHQWAWTMCNEFSEPLGIDIKPGIHYPSKPDPLFVVTDLMSNLQVDDAQASQYNGVLSMTGVSEQHRLKVSSRTYSEEMRRREMSKPVKIIDCSKIQGSASKPTDESVNSLTDQSENLPVEEKKFMSNYLNEKPLRRPNANSSMYSTSIEDFVLKDENFPPIGGRGVSIKHRIINPKKAPLGKGQGHT
ncbi:hypothetical protein PUN28_008960 [Cardiocondyla obscurior]|uniref:Uncharacterized protein n=2 Tax=Cardiocondyla obscurior TaxID=286306 RepID=A0AAW2FR74_9HYME